MSEVTVRRAYDRRVRVEHNQLVLLQNLVHFHRLVSASMTYAMAHVAQRYVDVPTTL